MKISKYQLLNLMNIEFNKGIKIVKDDDYKIDKSLINTRNDFSFQVKEYSKMLEEMNNWIIKYNYIYQL